MSAGQRFSGSEWSRILKGGGLVVMLGIAAYIKLLFNYWLIDCGTIHTFWIVKNYLFI